MTAATPTWLTVFVDLPPDAHDAGTRFWRAATGYGLSPARGDDGEFASLVPTDADPHLKLQRTGTPGPGVHLDLHVPDVDAALDHATAVGATLVARPGHAVLRSPAGFVLCLVDHPAAAAAPPADWGGHRSRVDQLTIDLPPDAHDREARFWSELTGWPVTSASRPEMARLHTPPELPVRVLLQRLDEGGTGGHLDVASDDRAAEVARLVAAGAREAGAGGPGWTVLTTPYGARFCVTDRDPATGLLPRH